MNAERDPKSNVQMTGPYDSIRDYIAALDARGRLIRIKEMDQDQYEATAFAYRLIEKQGYYEAPPFLIERIKVDGEWMDGPVIGNIYGAWDTEAISFGVEEITDNQEEMYRAAFDKVESLRDERGGWKKLDPVTVDHDTAPCKEVILLGNDADVLKFPFLKTNPGDGGRYINAGSLFLQDPELGRNVGTYRCQVKGSRKVGVNTETGQHGWNFLMQARKRGDKSTKAAIVIGADPIIFALACSKAAGLGEDELQLAGGLKGRPVELVKCETSDVMVPAHAEIVIEGEIPLDMEEEGPFGEVYGYMGLKKPKNFYMNIEAITHRRNPWIINSFAGITKLVHGMMSAVQEFNKYKPIIPNIVDISTPREAEGITIISIDKRMPGEGMAAGQHVSAGSIFAKTIIVVDKDVQVRDFGSVMHAVGSRWQPHPASVIIPQTKGMPLDPSAPTRWMTSKIIIDATKQLPEEGGPDHWPASSRELLEEQFPQAFGIVDKNWSEYLEN